MSVVISDDVENLGRPHVEDGSLAWNNLERCIHGEEGAEIDGRLSSSFVHEDDGDGWVTGSVEIAFK